jgi:hypothetical protein
MLKENWHYVILVIVIMLLFFVVASPLASYNYIRITDLENMTNDNNNWTGNNNFTGNTTFYGITSFLGDALFYNYSLVNYNTFNVTGDVYADYFHGDFSNATGLPSETDTLQTVTDRGAITDNDITIDRGGLLNAGVHLTGSVDSTIRSTATDQLQLRHNGINALTIDSLGDAYFYDEVSAGSFTGTLTWSDLSSYPSACPSGEFVTAVGDTLTCATTGTTVTAPTDEVVYYDGTNLAGTGIDNEDLASKTYVQGRGEQLISNGKGQMLSNYNFEFIPVDTTKAYMLSVWAKANNTVPIQYFGIAAYDADYNAIVATNHMVTDNGTERSSDTYLAQAVENGDTEVCLTDASGWTDQTASYRRGFIFWNYTNAQGYTYPDYTYSRDYSGAPLWDYGTDAINYTSNCITLNTAWYNGDFPAGIAVSQRNAGGQFKYIANPSPDINEDWQQLTGMIGNQDLSGRNQNFMFPPGTAFIKLLFLNNYAGSEPIQQWFSSFSFKEATPQTTLSTTNSDNYVGLTLENGDNQALSMRTYTDGTTDRWSIGRDDDYTPNYPLQVYGQIGGISLYTEYDVSAEDFIDRSEVSTDTNILETFKDGSELLNKDGSINHEALGQCYKSWEVADYSRPVITEVALPETTENGEPLYEQVTTYPYNKTEEGWSTSCEKAVTRQAFAQLNKALNINGSFVDVKTIAAEQILTKSKTPDFSVDYLDVFYMDNVKEKNTHYANIDGNYLGMEERIVALEGFATQILQELCLENPSHRFCSEQIKEDALTRVNPYKQPQGAHDAYKKGDLIKWQNKVYTSKINANVWNPSTYPAGWELVI